jgi:adenine/guanine phosphoribosyltransferase-like PRPP-binding protein
VALADHIQDIPDFPKPGIVFKDITPLFLDHEALDHTVDALADGDQLGLDLATTFDSETDRIGRGASGHGSGISR